MKVKSFLFAVFAIFTVAACAQSDDYSQVLQKVMEKIESGDCAGAKNWYAYYKEMTGRGVSSIEVLIGDCTNRAGKKYALNDKIKIGEYLYRVAYIEEDGVHGFAIYDYGSGPINEQMITGRKLPTRSEINLIYPNRKKLNLLEDINYWTIDRYDTSQNYYCKMGSNNISFSYNPISNSYAILLIYRF